MKDIKKNRTPDGSREAGFDRRRFIRTSVGAGAGLALSRSIGWADERADGPLPTRVLGRTGERVTILGLGTAPVGEGPPDVQEAVKVFGAALDAGVTYVDTARGYGNAEEALGHLLPKRRDNLFVVTKCWTDSAEGAEKSLSESLRRLRIDHVDLVHIPITFGTRVAELDRLRSAAGCEMGWVEELDGGMRRVRLAAALGLL